MSKPESRSFHPIGAGLNGLKQGLCAHCLKSKKNPHLEVWVQNQKLEKFSRKLDSTEAP